MEKILIILELIVSIILITLILTQNKDGGLSATFGGGESFQSTKRGPEKIIFNATVFLSGIFIINAMLIAIV